jgi:hypothetical protein
VRESGYGDVVKVLLWVICSLLLALLLTLITYNGCKALAELSITKDFGGMADWFANWSRGAEMEDFFRINWGLGALLFLLPLIEWLRLGKQMESEKHRPPHDVGVDDAGRLITHNRLNPLQALIGFFISFGILIMIAVIMVKTGNLAWAHGAEQWHKGLWINIASSCFVAIFMEAIFRSFMPGVFLRAMNIQLSFLLAALIFGFVFFLLAGFPLTRTYDTETISLSRLVWILFMEGDVLRRMGLVFLPWFAFGCILGWSRWRTASIMLPSGLLAGYFLALCLVKKATRTVESASVGSWNAGLPAIAGVLAIGILVHLFTKPHTHAGDHEKES